MNTASYIVRRLQQLGVDTLFGVVGFPCADFFQAAESAGMTVVSTASDLEAGYAVDGYARLKGLGVASVAYGPGTLSLINAMAGAYVEKSPMVIVSGGPTRTHLTNEQNYGVLFSHSTGRPSTDFHVAEQVTASAVQVRDVGTAANQIDTTLRVALTKRRPVYIEVASNLWNQDIGNPGAVLQPNLPASGNEPALAQQILARLSAAAHPAILLGEEIQRYRLHAEAQAMLAALGIRWATTTLGKSCLAENTANFAGTYSGRNAPLAVKNFIEDSDYVLALGCVFSTGYIELAGPGNPNPMARCYDGTVQFDQGARTLADLRTLLIEITNRSPFVNPPAVPPPGPPALPPTPTAPATDMTYDEFFNELRRAMSATWIVVGDTSLSILPAANLHVVGRDAFLAGSVWASIGHSVGAGLGASFATSTRPLIICGDGGFQMTSTTLSTMARYHKACVVIVIDNALYGYEQYLLDRTYYTGSGAPLSYAVLPRWDYVALANSLGVTHAIMANSPAALAAALQAAAQWTEPGLISVRVRSRTRPGEWP